MTEVPNATDMQIGRNLRRIRRDRNLSQKKLAEAVGITFQQIQKYELGANRIGGSRMAQICLALAITPMDLFHGVSFDHTKALPAQPLLSGEERDFIAAARRVEPTARSRTLKSMTGFFGLVADVTVRAPAEAVQ